MVGLSALNHFIWFRHFLKGVDYHGLDAILACYCMLVWAVPLFFLAACTTDATSLPQYGIKLSLMCRRKTKEREFVQIYLLEVFYK